MMSLNNNAGAQAIFYLCATSTTIALLVTLGSVSTVAGAASTDSTTTTLTISPLPMLAMTASPNMHNSTEMQANATNEEKSSNLNHFQKNNRNDSIMVLSPSLSTPSRDWNTVKQHSNNEQVKQLHLDQHSFEMENSRKYLHLDEHNFVATTPKIQTTKLPNRYAYPKILRTQNIVTVYLILRGNS